MVITGAYEPSACGWMVAPVAAPKNRCRGARGSVVGVVAVGPHRQRLRLAMKSPSNSIVIDPRVEQVETYFFLAVVALTSWAAEGPSELPRKSTSHSRRGRAYRVDGLARACRLATLASRCRFGVRAACAARSVAMAHVFCVVLFCPALRTARQRRRRRSEGADFMAVVVDANRGDGARAEFSAGSGADHLEVRSAASRRDGRRCGSQLLVADAGAARRAGAPQCGAQAWPGPVVMRRRRRAAADASRRKDASLRADSTTAAGAGSLLTGPVLFFVRASPARGDAR